MSQITLGSGQYNASDLNRVESWCRYLADELNRVGYNINITTKTDWVQTDMRTASAMERIRKNILKIMQGYHWISKIYATAESFDYIKANNWEKILFEIFNMLWRNGRLVCVFRSSQFRTKQIVAT